MNHPALEKTFFFRGREFHMTVLDLFDLIGYHLCPQASSRIAVIEVLFWILEDRLSPNKQSDIWELIYSPMEIDELLLHFVVKNRSRYICVDRPLCRACKFKGFQYRRHLKDIGDALARLVISVRLDLHVLADHRLWYFVNNYRTLFLLSSNEFSCVLGKSCNIQSWSSTSVLFLEQKIFNTRDSCKPDFDVCDTCSTEWVIEISSSVSGRHSSWVLKFRISWLDFVWPKNAWEISSAFK